MSDSSQQLPSVLTRGVAEVLPDPTSLAKLMSERKIKLYLGIDPTGSLLTLGHSVVLRKLQQFADLGHDVILLIGNGTVRIGDPTGRDSTRPVLTDEIINENFKTWQAQASKVLDFSKIKIMHNGDWLDKLTYADMVKLMAQTTVQQLVERDMFQERIKKGLPIFGHEIMYPLLQGYDSVAMNVDLELGGTDQTFNMMMGRHLQGVYNNHEKWVLSTPIINGTDGRKMSKSYGNFVALTEAPNDMYGKLMSIADELIIEYFTLLTDVADAEIAEMSAAIKRGENPMQFKKLLAYTITTMYHSAEDAAAAQTNFEKTVQNKEVGEVESFECNMAEDTVLNILKVAPTGRSSSDLKRLVEQGGVSVVLKDGSEEKVTELDKKYAVANIDIVKVGKRGFYRPVVK
jgi:tyrosyl-tRNA synthetase